MEPVGVIGKLLNQYIANFTTPFITLCLLEQTKKPPANASGLVCIINLFFLFYFVVSSTFPGSIKVINPSGSTLKVGCSWSSPFAFK